MLSNSSSRIRRSPKVRRWGPELKHPISPRNSTSTVTLACFFYTTHIISPFAVSKPSVRWFEPFVTRCAQSRRRRINLKYSGDCSQTAKKFICFMEVCKSYVLNIRSVFDILMIAFTGCRRDSYFAAGVENGTPFNLLCPSKF